MTKAGDEAVKLHRPIHYDFPVSRLYRSPCSSVVVGAQTIQEGEIHRGGQGRRPQSVQQRPGAG
jgi:hypothetical protein